MRHVGRKMGEVVYAGDILRVAELDIAFHSLICVNQSNRRLVQLWSTLNAQHAALIHSRLSFHHYDGKAVAALHTKLCDLLATGDPDASEVAVRSHYVGQGWHRE
jgi:DNA-binding GntR family transcriptional regulator